MPEVDAEDERNGHGGVAPVMSEEKAQFAFRQVLSTLTGGLLFVPGMTYRAHLVQFAVWLLPAVWGVAAAVELQEEPAWLRLAIGGFGGAFFVTAVDVFRWCVSRAASTKEIACAGRNNWFVDYDEVDYSNLLSVETMQALLPPRRTRLHSLVAPIFSFAFIGTAAAVLDPSSVEEDFGPGVDKTVLASIIFACFLAVAVAQYAVTVRAPVEVSAYRHRDPRSLDAFLADHSRPFLVVLLFAPMLLASLGAIDSLGGTGAGLRLATAALPVCWVLGLVPQLDTATLWLLDQCEVHLFGGTPLVGPMRLVAGLAASVMGSVAVVVSAKATDSLVLETTAAIAVVVCLAAATVLTLLPPWPLLSSECHGQRWQRGLVLASLQSVVGGGCGAGLLVVLGAEAVGGSMRAERESVVWAIRFVAEQVAGLLCLLAFRGPYMNWLRAALGKKPLCVGSARSAMTKTQSRWSMEGVELFALLARILLVAHLACFGAVALIVTSVDVHRFFQAVLLLRAFRVALVDTPRAVGDAWLTGIVDVVLVVAVESKEESSFLRWSLGLRLLVISLARQRIAAVFARAGFVFYLSWAAHRIPKLWHRATPRLLVTNLVLCPFLLLVVCVSALLESPLLALFTLPCFVVGYPRPRYGHPEVSFDGTTNIKGMEGLFYSILAPSLLEGLRPIWRSRSIDPRPGSILLCRSHERLLCMVRVLSAGFGWVQVELRGLELQEPTSCHNVEAGRVDDAFALAFDPSSEGSARLPHTRVAERSDSNELSEPPLLVAVSTPAPLHVLTPVCTVSARTYEQTRISMTGILDNQETLRQLHKLFLKTLFWVMAKHCASRNAATVIPGDWLSMPLKGRDVQASLKLFEASSWKEHVRRVWELTEEGEKYSDAVDAETCQPAVAATASTEQTAMESLGLDERAVKSAPEPPPPSRVRPPTKEAPSALLGETNEFASSPQRLPSRRLSDQGGDLADASPCSTAIGASGPSARNRLYSETGSGGQSLAWSLGCPGIIDDLESDSSDEFESNFRANFPTATNNKKGKPETPERMEDDVDTLMNMLLDSHPASEAKLRSQRQPSTIGGIDDLLRTPSRPESGVSTDVPWSTSRPRSGRPASATPLPLAFKDAGRPASATPLPLVFKDCPLETFANGVNGANTVATGGGMRFSSASLGGINGSQGFGDPAVASGLDLTSADGAAASFANANIAGVGASAGSGAAFRDSRHKVVGSHVPPSGASCNSQAPTVVNDASLVAGLDTLTRLVIQSYVAMDVAPVYGQTAPEALGAGHVVKVFDGSVTHGCSAAEVKWLSERPELLDVTLRAFRYAFKVTLDCAAMAEDAADLEDTDLEERLTELDSDWFLGMDGTLQWQAAMEERRPYLMSLRRKTGAEYQVLRLCIAESEVKIGHLLPEAVQSIWASASLELRYLANDDDERYSIQAHPTLLRNLVVQSAEYPIYVSPPTVVWL
jgi:hypothetical protein